MAEVVALGYLGLTAPDVDEWRTYATELLGLAIGEAPNGTPEGQLRLRMDERGWRFTIEPGEQGGLAYAGWEVPGPVELARLHARLKEAGVDAVSDPELAAERGVGALVRCDDPDGNRLEFFYGGFIPQSAFVSPTGTEFVTGHLGIGHIVLPVADVERSRAFYLDLLDFKLSDIIVMGTRKVYFTHVNPRHHSLAFAESANRRSNLNHFMLETTTLDAVGRALDRVQEAEIKLTQTFGRHTNDLMASFYIKTPSGFEVEYGCGGRHIDDSTWSVTTFDKPSFWGHQRL